MENKTAENLDILITELFAQLEKVKDNPTEYTKVCKEINVAVAQRAALDAAPANLNLEKDKLSIERSKLEIERERLLQEQKTARQLNFWNGLKVVGGLVLYAGVHATSIWFDTYGDRIMPKEAQDVEKSIRPWW